MPVPDFAPLNPGYATAMRYLSTSAVITARKAWLPHLENGELVIGPRVE